MQGESAEERSARERLTGVLLLLAVAVGAAAGIATGDVGLGFGAFIAACLVGGMVLQRRHPGAEPPPRWGMVLSFVTGPLVVAAGVVELAGDELLVGGIRLACGLVSVAFALDQWVVRRRRRAALLAGVRASLARPDVVVGTGWRRPDVRR